MLIAENSAISEQKRDTLKTEIKKHLESCELK